MGKCREALGEEGGDLEKSVEWLRRRGVKSMEKRATDAAEALLGLSVAADGSAGGLVEVRCETDFVTRSDLFQAFCLSLAHVVEKRPVPAQGDAAEGLLDVPLGASSGNLAADTLVKTALLERGSVLGEKLVLGQAFRLAAPDGGGIVAGYVHPKFADGQANTGRMGSLVAIRPLGGTADAEGLRAVAALLARHIVAAQPRYVSIASVPVEVLQKERETMQAAHLEQLGSLKAGKVDDKVLAKVLDGKTQKWYSESVLLCQELIAAQSAADDAKPLPVAEWLDAQAKVLGVEKIAIEDFRFAAL